MNTSSDALMEECVRMMQHSLRASPSIKKRAKSVYQQRNLGTIKNRKKEKKQEKEKEVARRMGPSFIEFPSEAYAHELFMNRINRLRRYVDETRRKRLPNGERESLDQIRERIAKKDEKRRDESRDNTRRAEVMSLNILTFVWVLKYFFRFIEAVSKLLLRTCSTKTDQPIRCGNIYSISLRY